MREWVAHHEAVEAVVLLPRRHTGLLLAGVVVAVVKAVVVRHARQVSQVVPIVAPTASTSTSSSACAAARRGRPAARVGQRRGRHVQEFLHPPAATQRIAHLRIRPKNREHLVVLHIAQPSKVITNQTDNL